MKMDRSLNANGRGKYALIKLRNMPADHQSGAQEVKDAISVLIKYGMWDWGYVGTEAEFMLIRLKDKYALKALQGYFSAIMNDDPSDLEYAEEILNMMKRAGPNSQWCKRPD